jgi:chromosome segregation ATPase
LIGVLDGVKYKAEENRLRASALRDSLQICANELEENRVYLQNFGENLTEKQKKLAKELEAKNKAIANKELELNDALAEAERERTRLVQLREELEKVSNRVKELEAELRRKDSAAASLLFEKLSPIAKSDLKEYSKFIKKYQGPIDDFTTQFYTQFLHVNNQPEGMQSYSRVVGWVWRYLKMKNEE